MGCFCVLKSDAKYFATTELARLLSWYGCPIWDTDPHSTSVFWKQNTSTFLGDGKGKGKGWKASGMPKKIKHNFSLFCKVSSVFS